MSTNASRPHSLAQVSSGSRLILDSTQSARRSLRVAQAVLVTLESAAGAVRAAAARGEMGEVLTLASVVGQTLAAVEPLYGLGDVLAAVWRRSARGWPGCWTRRRRSRERDGPRLRTLYTGAEMKDANRPKTEVLARPERRCYAAEYKARVLAAADARRRQAPRRLRRPASARRRTAGDRWP